LEPIAENRVKTVPRLAGSCRIS